MKIRAAHRGSGAASGSSGVDRDADVVPIAHQQQLRDLLHRERQPDDAVAAIVGRIRQQRHDAAGIVSQYDVVCICCSGRSSSPEPTFSFV